jgi:formylglycine-generating enzyme required for sulfatase activity
MTWRDVDEYRTPAGETRRLAADSTLTFRGVYELAFGDIVIDQIPDDLPGAGWTLTGPRNETGSGDATLEDVPVGEYTLCWVDVEGYIEPLCETERLDSEEPLVFAGTYSEDPGEESNYVLIPAGSFTMGSPLDEPGRDEDEVAHVVTLSRAFFMSKREVTEEWWDVVMGSGTSTSRLPKDDVSWDMAVAFCNALSLMEELTPAYTINGPDGDVTWNQEADGYRRPTEAEWEYACRAGNQEAFHTGPITGQFCNVPNLDLVGWYCGNADGQRRNVGRLEPNAWGLYDMHGNMWEWVWDGYRLDYENLSPQDPVTDAAPGANRVARGGGWANFALYCRSASRGQVAPDQGSNISGFRLVRSVF